MARISIKMEGLGKRYRLGETHETTLSGKIAAVAGRLAGRIPMSAKEPQDFWALRGVDLEVAEGEAVGIIGGNGAGKSTLLKILSRITQPTTGRALVRGRLSSLLEVGTGFHPELTGRENVFLNGTILGMRKHEVARKFDEIVAFAGVEKFIDTPVKRYSSGMYVRLAFAVAAHLEPDVLIVDEVLAVGDAEFQARCMGKMGDVQREGRTILFVSHNMAAIQQLCSRAVLMRGGTVETDGDVRKCIAAHLGMSRSAEPMAVLPAGDPRFQMNTISLRDAKRELRREFAFDEDVMVEIRHQQFSRVANIELGMRVSTGLGATVFATQRPGHQIGPLPLGEGVSTVRIPARTLVPGVYLVTIGAHVPGVQVLGMAENILSFVIHETGSALSKYAGMDIGSVIVECDWNA